MMEIICTRLCTTASSAPVAITLHCEHILIELGKTDPNRMLRLMLKYSSSGKSNSSTASNNSPHVRLLALHVLASAVSHLTSSQLIDELPEVIDSVLPSLTSTLVDMRQAVVMLLVECYVILGDALFPFIGELTPPQSKLLMIYVEKRMQQLGK